MLFKLILFHLKRICILMLLMLWSVSQALAVTFVSDFLKWDFVFLIYHFSPDLGKHFDQTGNFNYCQRVHKQTAVSEPPKVPGEIKRSRDLRGRRWSWTFKLSQKRSWVGRWSWAAKVGLLSLRVVQVVRQQQCNGHCLCDSAQAQQLKQQLRSAQVAGQWRGDTALTLPLFWRPSTVSPVFFGRYPQSSLHSFVPFPPCPRP